MPRNKVIAKPIVRKSFHLKFGTWNLQGKLSEPLHRDRLMQDLSCKKIHLAALQETHYQPNKDFPSVFDGAQGKLICLNPPAEFTSKRQQYGMGFYVSKELVPHIHGMRSISNRIGVLRLKLNKTKSKTQYLTVINAYAPTMQCTQTTPEATDEFYEQLFATYELYKTSSLLMIGGDFNAKLGMKRPDDIEESIIGRFGKGFRNENGNRLAGFLQQSNFLAANTCFQHPMRHRSTWTSPVLVNHLGKLMYNQIDYILVPQQLALRRHLLINARSYSNQSFESDHKIVIAEMDLTAQYKCPRDISKGRCHRYDSRLLNSLDAKYREDFQLEMERITSDLSDAINSPVAPRKVYKSLVKAFHEAATRTLPRQPTSKRSKPTHFGDPLLDQLSKRQQSLRRRIESSKNRNHVAHLRRIRYDITKCIRERLRILRVERINDICAELERNKGNKQAYEAMRMLQRITHKPLMLTDPDGHHLHTAYEMDPIFTAYYTQFFNQPDHSTVLPWGGDIATPLVDPIRCEETEAAIQFLNNNRASGSDDISAEMFKYGGKHIARIVTSILNGLFEKQCNVEEILDGLLILLNKPNNKPKTADNTRPITLLNVIRKILSTVTLFRIREATGKFISISQSGFRANRSTSDVLWSYRWMTAITQKYKVAFRIIGIDMSKAFDSVNRTMLLESLDQFLQPTEIRIIRYLLSETRLRTRIKGQLGQWFGTNAGIPQGDALSPLLFAIYLELAVRRFKEMHPEYGETIDHFITHYADDTDFIDRLLSESLLDAESLGGQMSDLRAFEQEIDASMSHYNLKLNRSKTEFTLLNRKTSVNLSVKKLGTILDPTEDVRQRIELADQAFGTYWRLWLRKEDVPFPTKLRLYNAAIAPILLYNLHTCGLTATLLKSVDTCHRKHLRRMWGVFYPDRISNEMLYIMTLAQPLSATIIDHRWRLFGHILRLPQNTPANVAMRQYFRYGDLRTAQKYTGQCPYSIQRALHDDLLCYEEPTQFYYGRRRPRVVGLQTLKDLNFYARKAEDRELWKALVTRIRTGYERDLWNSITGDDREDSNDNTNTISTPSRRRLRRRTRRMSDSSSGAVSNTGVSSANSG